eukprot:4865166-Amphidinium_carterae.1
METSHDGFKAKLASQPRPAIGDTQSINATGHVSNQRVNSSYTYKSKRAQPVYATHVDNT